MAETPRSPKLLLGALLALLAGAPLAAGPAGCDVEDDGFGSIQAGVQSFPLTLVFNGLSPGYCLRDLNLTGGPDTIEDDIVLDAANPTVERLIYLGGRLETPVSFQGRAITAGGTSTLEVTLSLLRADDPTPVLLDREAVTIGQALTPFIVTLDIPQDARSRSLPGDIAVLALSRQGADLTLVAPALIVRGVVFFGEDLRLTLVDAGVQAPAPALREVPPPGSRALTVGTTPVVATFALASLGGPLYDTAGTGTGATATPSTLTYRFEGESRFSVLASTNGLPADVLFELLVVDAQGNPIGPVGAMAGPFRVEATAARLEGTFVNTQSSTFTLGNTVSARSVPVLGLRITTTAATSTTTVTFALDAATNRSSTFVFLPRPRVIGDFGSAAQVQLSQP